MNIFRTHEADKRRQTEAETKGEMSRFRAFQTRINQGFFGGADMLPENERASFRSGVQEALDGLRQSINLGTIPEPPALYRERTAQQEADRTALLAKAPRQFRESAKVRLQQLQRSEDKASPLPQHEPGRPVKSKYHSWIRAQEARKRSVSEHRSRQSKPRKSPER